LKTGDYSRAIERLQPWANVGDSDAQFMLGQIHAFGWGVPKDDDAAINWFRRAGKFREPNVDAAAPAEFYVGVTYLNGHGVQKDGAEAKRWFARSAQGGFRKAAAQLESMTTLPKTLE
jgi:TPR repeat protein